MLKRPRSKGIVVKFTDEIGEDRTIHKDHKGVMRVQKGDTPTLLLNQEIGPLVGSRIKKERKKKGYGLHELAIRSGIKATDRRALKSRMQQIEKGNRNSIRLGTLYTIALALEIEACELLPTLEEVLDKTNISIVEKSYPTLGINDGSKQWDERASRPVKKAPGRSIKLTPQMIEILEEKGFEVG